MYAVVMAGGGGTRLWPVSRRHRPKQALQILGDQSLFQATVERLRPMISPERILVVTVQDQADLLRAQAQEIPTENFLIEPSPRGTASVIGLAAVELIKRDPGATMACLPADHFIRRDELFRDALQSASVLAERDYLVTLGVSPSGPETGYGYIEKGASLDVEGSIDAWQVQSFKEKPDVGLAGEYVLSGHYLWNAGIFVWKCRVILEEIARYMPDLSRALSEIEQADGDFMPAVESVWPGLRPETIDYGVMEKAEHVAMLDVGAIGWFDVGSWDRLFDLLKADTDGNVVVCERAELIDTKSSLVYQLRVPDAERIVALVGVEDLIVVDAGDAILVTSRGEAQRVRELVGILKANHEDGYL
jgi:mannose-1-phosphate guanylyltransferase